MSQFKKGRGGKLVLEKTAEEKAAAFDYIKAKIAEDEKKAEAKALEKRLAKEAEEKHRLAIKEKEKNILAKIAATPEQEQLVVAEKKPEPKAAKGKVLRTQTSATVENILWPFKKALGELPENGSIYVFPGQMIVPKCLVQSQEKFRTFFSPSDQVIGRNMVIKGFVDPTKIVLYREDPTHYYIPDFSECFSQNTDLNYDTQQVELRKLFRDGKIPKITRFTNYFLPAEDILPLEDVISDTGDVDEDKNPIYAVDDIRLKSEQVATLKIVHEYFSKEQNRRILLKLGTGVGKTFTALIIAKMLNPEGKVAIVVNTKNQIDYWYSEIEKIFPGELTLDYNSSAKNFTNKFHKSKFFIFSQQSAAYTQEKIFDMYQYSDSDRKGVLRDVGNWFNQFSIVIVDECHEMCSDTRRPFASNFANSYIIGLSATPDLKETVKRITFLYYGNVISASKLLLYAAKKGITLKPTIYEYETIYKIVNYLSYPVYTEVDDCVKGHISMRKEEVPLPQCLTAKINADVHRVYMLAHIALETALEGRCTILLCKTVDYLYMIRDAIQRLMRGDKPIMLHDPNAVIKFKNFNPDYPRYLEKAVLPEGKCHEVEEITLRYRPGIGEKAKTIRLGGKESAERYKKLLKDPLYNNPIIINSKYKGDWDENSVTEAIENTNLILSTVQSLGTGYNIKKANTIIMAHSVIMAYEQCVGRIKRDTVGIDRHGYDIIDSGCGVFKSQYNKRCKRFYNNHDDKKEMHFYEADDIILEKDEGDTQKETKVRRTRLAAGDAPVSQTTTTSAPVEKKKCKLVDLPEHLVNYKATIDVVPQASKMQRLKKVAAVLDEDDELDAWGE